MILQNATGDKQGAKIDSTARLHTYATTIPEDRSSNEDGRTWSVYGNVTPTAANDYFFYLKNTGTNLLAVTDIRLITGTATTVTVEPVTGEPNSLTSVSPVSRNLGLSKTITGTIGQAVDITGLTSLGVLFPIRADTANEMAHLRTTSNILIPAGSAFALKRVASTGSIEYVVSVTELESVKHEGKS